MFSRTAGGRDRCWRRCSCRSAPAAARAADDATLLRVFLNDGTSLVSYGELARVGDRVVFSMPTDGDAESAAASRESSRRPRRLGADQPLRRLRARRALRRDAGAKTTTPRSPNQVAQDAERGGAHRRPGAAAGDRRERAAGRSPTGRRTTTTTGRPKCGRCWRCSTKRSPTCAPRAGGEPFDLTLVGVRRSAADRRAAAAAADAAGSDRAGARRRARWRTSAAERMSLLATAAGDDRPRRGRAAGRLGRGDARRRVATPCDAELRLDRSYQSLTARIDGVGGPARARAPTCAASSGCSSSRCAATTRRSAASGRTRSTRSWPRSKRSSTRRGGFGWRAIAGRCARRSCAATASAIGAPIDLFTRAEAGARGHQGAGRLAAGRR